PDTFTTFIEIADCGQVQAHYYLTANGSALSTAQRSAINGHKNTGFCAAWISAFLPAGDPTRAQNCGFTANYPLVYNKTTNPKGIRCAGPDHDVALLGTYVAADGVTRTVSGIDNVGL